MHLIRPAAPVAHRFHQFQPLVVAEPGQLVAVGHGAVVQDTLAQLVVGVFQGHQRRASPFIVAVEQPVALVKHLLGPHPVGELHGGGPAQQVVLIGTGLVLVTRLHQLIALVVAVFGQPVLGVEGAHQVVAHVVAKAGPIRLEHRKGNCQTPK